MFRRIDFYDLFSLPWTERDIDPEVSPFRAELRTTYFLCLDEIDTQIKYVILLRCTNFHMNVPYGDYTGEKRIEIKM